MNFLNLLPFGNYIKIGIFSIIIGLIGYTVYIYHYKPINDLKKELLKITKNNVELNIRLEKTTRTLLVCEHNLKIVEVEEYLKGLSYENNNTYIDDSKLTF